MVTQTSLDLYKRGNLPALPESSAKYLQQELAKLEKQAASQYDKFQIVAKDLNGALASITQIRQVLTGVDPDGTHWALAEDLETLIAQVGDNKAEVDDFKIAYASDKEAYAIRSTNLDAVFGANSANVVQVLQAYSNGSQSIATLQTNLSAAFGENAANAKQILQAIADANQTSTVFETNLAAAFGPNAANAQSLMQAIANANSTSAQYQVNLSAVFGANAANLSTVLKTYSDATSAVSQRVTDLTTTVGDNKATAHNELTSSVGPGSAIATAITNLNAAFGPNSANASSTLQTYASNITAAGQTANYWQINAKPLDQSNLVITPTFENGAPTWGNTFLRDTRNVAGVPSQYRASWNQALGFVARDTSEGLARFPVLPGEVFYLEAYLNSVDTPHQIAFGIEFHDEAGNAVDWNAGTCFLAPGIGWTHVTGVSSTAVGSVTWGRAWLQIAKDGSTPPDGSGLASQLYISRQQKGATNGATWGVNVSGSQTVDQNIAAADAKGQSGINLANGAQGTANTANGTANTANSNANEALRRVGISDNNIAAITAIGGPIYTANGRIDSLGNRIDTVESLGGAGNLYTRISQYQTSINGIIGRAGLTILNNGVVSGFALLSQADPTGGNVRSNFVIQSNIFGIIRPGGDPNNVADYSVYWNGSQLVVRGDILATGIVQGGVSTLSIAPGAVTVVRSQTFDFGGQGFNAHAELTVNMPYAGTLHAQVTYSQAVPSPWSAYLKIDGVAKLQFEGNPYPQGLIPLAGSADVAAGNHTVSFDWVGSGNDIIGQAVFLVVGYMR